MSFETTGRRPAQYEAVGGDCVIGIDTTYLEDYSEHAETTYRVKIESLYEHTHNIELKSTRHLPFLSQIAKHKFMCGCLLCAPIASHRP